MDPNEFVQKLKANGSESDWTDLAKVYEDFKIISGKLSSKDRSSFSLNVLCILCRNLDKIPSWKPKINNNILLHISIECVRELRTAERTDRIKTLACIYHIHKHIIKQNSDLPPELVLKLSYMPFENEATDLLKEYAKTYWNILADRITYLEKLKQSRPIIKLMPKIIKDIIKVIYIYDTVQFCMNILSFVVKKMHFLYSEHNAKDLNEAYERIFECFTLKTDYKSIKSAVALEIYVKFNDCFYVIVENNLKCDFKETNLNSVVRSCMVVLGQHTDLFHCLQTIYLNSFCGILAEKCNPLFLESILNGLLVTCESTEKLGYEKVMKATYPYVNQLLRIYIEYMVNNSEIRQWNEHFTDAIQVLCLKLINLLMKKLKTTTQMLKCDGCTIKSGLHDALRLSFLVKNFVTISLNQKICLDNILPYFYQVIQSQHIILQELCILGCFNYDKCYRKLQTDIHNIAISLNKAQYFKYSINLFNIYLKNEIKHFKTNSEMKNISRALYNKSICELDAKQFDESLQNSFLSLIFALPEGLTSPKYMSLVMDIKAKGLKEKTEENDKLQTKTILKSCENLLESGLYGNLRPFLKQLKFSELLRHEFDMYCQLWPSIVPIAGVWKSLHNLCKGEIADWVLSEPKDKMYRTLFEIIVKTTSAVRTIHCEYYIEIIDDLLNELNEKQSKNTELWLIEASLLSIKCEYNLAEASVKYEWKTKDLVVDSLSVCAVVFLIKGSGLASYITGMEGLTWLSPNDWSHLMNTEPEQSNYNRTLPQEYTALLPAFNAVDIWTRIFKNITLLTDSKLLRCALKIASLVAHELIYCNQTTPALQLAYICLKFGKKLNDTELIYTSMNIIVPRTMQYSTEIADVISLTGSSCLNDKSVDLAMEYMANISLHYHRCGKSGLAASLLQLAQSKLMETLHKNPDINLDFAIGRVMFALLEICGDGKSLLTQINSLQRHYLALNNTETSWINRRVTYLRRSIVLFDCTSVGVSRLRSLRAWSRAASASAVLCVCSAVNSVLLASDSVCVDRGEHAQVKIDNCLKHILGLQSNNEPQSHNIESQVKPQLFTPKNNLETMLENMVFKRTQTSPSIPCESVPGYRTPDFLKHSKECNCYACMTPLTTILACKVSGLESAVYSKAKEFDIASNYFNGTLNMFGLVEIKLKHIFDKYKKKYEDFLVNIAEKDIDFQFKKIQYQILLEAAYFELAQSNYEKSDDYVVRIYEINNEYPIDKYFENEFMNLMIVSAKMRSIPVPIDLSSLEIDMDNLKLTPTKEGAPPKTPELKASRPPKITDKKVVTDEEIPKLKRKVIKLNLDDEGNDTPDVKPTTRSRHVFKIPVPVTNKPIPETIPSNTPKLKAKIVITRPSEDLQSPKTGTKQEFFTPIETPTEKFLTPLTSIKTYSKKMLRNNIVKNLESEFSTPKAEKEIEKENFNTASVSKLKLNTVSSSVSKTKQAKASESKRYLKRATSPGKLPKDGKKTVTRPKRVQRPNINFSLDED